MKITTTNRVLSILAAVLVFLFVSSSGQTKTSADAKVFIGANFIDGTGKLAVKNAVLVVRQGRLETVGPASAVRPPAGAQIINLDGKYIIPGLISTHVHISDVQ